MGGEGSRGRFEPIGTLVTCGLNVVIYRALLTRGAHIECSGVSEWEHLVVSRLVWMFKVPRGGEGDFWCLKCRGAAQTCDLPENRLGDYHELVG